MNLFLVFIVLFPTLVNADQQACLHANAQSDKKTIDICNATLESEGVSLDSKTIIYITQANYLIRNNDFDEANHILDRAFNSNHKILENNLFRYNWLRTKGSLYFVKGEYFNATPFYLQALEVANAMNNKINIANVFNDLGAVNLKQNKNQQALEWLQKSLSIFYQTDDTYHIALSLANIAEIYVNLKDDKKALEYFKKSIASLTKAIAHGGENRQLYEVSLAKIHISLGNLYITLSQNNNAVSSLDKALTIYQKNNLQPEQVDILSSLGKLSFQQSEIDTALSFYKQASNIEKLITETVNLELLENRINVYIFLKDLDQAEQFSVQGVKQAKLKNDSKFEVKFLYLLATIYQKKGEFEKTISYLKQAQRTKEQYLKSQFNNSRGQLLAEIDLVEKQRQLEKLEKQQSLRELDISKQYLMFVLLGVLLLIIIAYLLLQLKRNKKLKQSLITDQAVHHNQLELLNVSPSKLKTLFKGIECRYICFNSAGLIKLHSSEIGMNGKNRTMMMQNEFPDIWKTIIYHMNEEEKLENEMFLDINNNEDDFLSIWIHQMNYLDNTIICLLLDSETAQKQGFIEAENIRKYTQFNHQLNMLLSYINHIPMKKVAQLKQVTNAMKTLNAKSNSTKKYISQDEYKRILVDLMLSSIELWLSNTSYSTIELAEKSGLWLVSIEDGQLRTRTMNRYTDTKKIPNKPRWRQVVKTAHFILSNCNLNINEREQLNTKINIIKQFVRNQAFND